MGAPYDEIAHLKAPADYFEIIGIDGIENLTGTGDGGTSDDHSQVFLDTWHHMSTQRNYRPTRHLSLAIAIHHLFLVLTPIRPPVVFRRRITQPMLGSTHITHLVDIDDPLSVFVTPTFGGNHQRLPLEELVGTHADLPLDDRCAVNRPKPSKIHHTRSSCPFIEFFPSVSI